MIQLDAIEKIRNRAVQEDMRTDNSARWGCPDLAATVSRELVDAVELEVGFALWEEHRQVLMEVANGGFGPGDGLLGLPGGRLDDEGRSLTDVRKLLFSEDGFQQQKFFPICDWGCGIWFCVDCGTGEMLKCDEMGIKKLGIQFGTWLEKWASGANLWLEIEAA